MSITRYKRGRFWAVCDENGSLVCVCVYRKGATEVVRRLREERNVKQTELAPVEKGGR